MSQLVLISLEIAYLYFGVKQQSLARPYLLFIDIFWFILSAFFSRGYYDVGDESAGY